MSLYVVVHHRQDNSQPWKNAWLDDHLIEGIQTTKEIGKLCIQAKERGEQVFVHRCGYQEHLPLVCCSAEVDNVAEIDNVTTLVRFIVPTLLSENPPITPVRGQNFYIA